QAARGEEEQAFALGYLAHLAADVVAHNFFLPMRFVGQFKNRLASHLYTEARFDNLHDHGYQELLVKLVGADFAHLNRTLKRAIDSPLVSFGAHRAIFEGGLRRIREFNRLIRAIGRADASDATEMELFCEASCFAIDGVLYNPASAPACRFDPMGKQAI